MAEKPWEYYTGPHLAQALRNAWDLVSAASNFTDAADVRDYQQYGTEASRALLNRDWQGLGENAPAALASGVSLMLPGLAGLGGMVKRASDLPMDEASRMARAREMGFDVDAYKGAYPYDAETGPVYGFKNGKFEQIDNIGAEPEQLTQFITKGHGGFYARHPDIANRFAKAYNSGAMFPVKLKMENPLIIDAAGRPAAAFQFENIAKTEDSIQDMKAFRDALSSESGYDGVVIKNTRDEGTIYIPKTAQQVRSRFARFDPANKDSADLLASWAAALGLGGLAAGALAPSDAKAKERQ